MPPAYGQGVYAASISYQGDNRYDFPITMEKPVTTLISTADKAAAPQTTNPALVADALAKCVLMIGQIMLKRQIDPTWVVPPRMMTEVRTATLAIGNWFIEVEGVSTRATISQVGLGTPLKVTLTMTVLQHAVWEFSCTS